MVGLLLLLLVLLLSGRGTRSERAASGDSLGKKSMSNASCTPGDICGGTKDQPHGSCVLTVSGQPECTCASIWKGDACEECAPERWRLSL